MPSNFELTESYIFLIVVIFHPILWMIQQKFYTGNINLICLPCQKFQEDLTSTPPELSVHFSHEGSEPHKNYFIMGFHNWIKGQDFNFVWEDFEFIGKTMLQVKEFFFKII